MKYIKTVFLILFIFPSFYSLAWHDMKMGYFSIFEKDSKCLLQVNLDKEDLLMAIQRDKTLSDLDLENQIKTYINKNFSLRFNGELVNFNDWSFEYDNLIIKASAKIETSQKKVSKINARNTCLLNISEKQSNVLKVLLNERARSFRLHAGRKETVIEY